MTRTYADPLTTGVYIDGAALSRDLISGNFYGSQQTIAMVAEDGAADLSGATEIWSSATGCTAFDIKLFATVTAGTTYLAVGWDTEESATEIKTALAAVQTSIGTPDGNAVANTAVITDQSQVLRVTAADGTRIKTIAAVGNAAHKYFLTVVV